MQVSSSYWLPVGPVWSYLDGTSASSAEESGRATEKHHSPLLKQDSLLGGIVEMHTFDCFADLGGFRCPRGASTKCARLLASMLTQSTSAKNWFSTLKEVVEVINLWV